MTAYGMDFSSSRAVGRRRVRQSSSVATGTGTLVGFLAGLGWLAEMTGHFRVQYFWLLAASAFVLAVCKRGKLAAAGAALAAVNLAAIVPLYWGPAPSANERPVMRAMSLNVHWRSRDYARTLQWLRR